MCHQRRNCITSLIFASSLTGKLHKLNPINRGPSLPAPRIPFLLWGPWICNPRAPELCTVAGYPEAAPGHSGGRPAAGSAGGSLGSLGLSLKKSDLSRLNDSLLTLGGKCVGIADRTPDEREPGMSLTFSSHLKSSPALKCPAVLLWLLFPPAYSHRTGWMGMAIWVWIQQGIRQTGRKRQCNYFPGVQLISSKKIKLLMVIFFLKFSELKKLELE